MITPNLLGGGAERVALTISKGLLERGHQVDIVVFSEGNDYPNEVPDGVRPLVLDNLEILDTDDIRKHNFGDIFTVYTQAAKLQNWQLGLLPSFKQIRRAMRLAHYIDLSRPHCIVSHMSRPTIVAQLATSLAVLHAPVISVVHGSGNEMHSLRR